MAQSMRRALVETRDGMEEARRDRAVEEVNPPARKGQASARARNVSLTACLFVLSLIVFGQVLRMNALGALISAACSTPLAIHVFSRWIQAKKP